MGVEKKPKVNFLDCAHKNTVIDEPHLAGARKCLDCGAYKRSSSSEFQLVINVVGEKNMYADEFSSIIYTLTGLPDADKERLLMSAIKFFNLNQILRSECGY